MADIDHHQDWWIGATDVFAVTQISVGSNLPNLYKLNLEPTEPLVCPYKQNLEPTKPLKSKPNLEPYYIG